MIRIWFIIVININNVIIIILGMYVLAVSPPSKKVASSSSSSKRHLISGFALNYFCPFALLSLKIISFYCNFLSR